MKIINTSTYMKLNCLNKGDIFRIDTPDEDRNNIFMKMSVWCSDITKIIDSYTNGCIIVDLNSGEMHIFNSERMVYKIENYKFEVLN